MTYITSPPRTRTDPVEPPGRTPSTDRSGVRQQSPNRPGQTAGSGARLSGSRRHRRPGRCHRVPDHDPLPAQVGGHAVPVPPDLDITVPGHASCLPVGSIESDGWQRQKRRCLPGKPVRHNLPDRSVEASVGLLREPSFGQPVQVVQALEGRVPDEEVFLDIPDHPFILLFVRAR